jgi:hypothetical protein
MYSIAVFIVLKLFQMSSNKPGPDPELKKAFTELQTKMVDSKQKMRMADLQVRKRKIRRVLKVLQLLKKT